MSMATKLPKTWRGLTIKWEATGERGTFDGPFSGWIEKDASNWIAVVSVYGGSEEQRCYEQSMGAGSTPRTALSTARRVLIRKLNAKVAGLTSCLKLAG